MMEMSHVVLETEDGKGEDRNFELKGPKIKKYVKQN